MAERLAVRRSSRLVILDPEGRMLLFRYHYEHKDRFWSMIGGELKADEDYLLPPNGNFKRRWGSSHPRLE